MKKSLLQTVDKARGELPRAFLLKKHDKYYKQAILLLFSGIIDISNNRWWIAYDDSECG